MVMFVIFGESAAIYGVTLAGDKGTAVALSEDRHVPLPFCCCCCFCANVLRVCYATSGTARQYAVHTQAMCMVLLLRYATSVTGVGCVYVPMPVCLCCYACADHGRY